MKTQKFSILNQSSLFFKIYQMILRVQEKTKRRTNNNQQLDNLQQLQQIILEFYLYSQKYLSIQKWDGHSQVFQELRRPNDQTLKNIQIY
ncbi:hypothetical protein pb186bvf_010461 [Paramecium bursaria]